MSRILPSGFSANNPIARMVSRLRPGASRTSGAEPATQPTHRLLTLVPSSETGGLSGSRGGATFFATTAGAVGGIDWNGEVENVRTFEQFIAVFDKIRKLRPEAQQVEPLALLTRHIGNITERKDQPRARALWTIDRAARSLNDQVDRIPILRALPVAAKSLAPGHQEAGYRLVHNAVMDARNAGMDDENYGVSLADLADLLTVSQDSEIPARFGNAARSFHTTEVNLIFDNLETLSPRHRMNALLPLCQQRFRLSHDAADIVTHRALQASASHKFKTQQRIDIVDSLVSGLETLALDDDRFDPQLSAIFEGFWHQSGVVGKATLSAIWPHRDRISLAPMQHAIERVIFKPAAGTHGPSNKGLSRAEVVLQVVDNEIADLRLQQREGFPFPETPEQRANSIATLFEPMYFESLSDTDTEGERSNPRFQCYMDLRSLLCWEMEDLAPGLRGEDLELALSEAGARGKALLRANAQMVQARELLKSSERAFIDEQIATQTSIESAQ